MTRPHILLDLDGVCADFISAALWRHGRADLLQNYPLGLWDVEEVLGITASQFWAKVDDYDFWRGLSPYSWMYDLVEHCRSIGDVTVSTSPSLSPECAEGKVAWMHEHLSTNGQKFTDYMIGKQKFLLAGPGRILIDDNDRNCELFRASGGQAVLFPQPWNSAQERDPYSRLDEVKALVEESAALSELG